MTTSKVLAGVAAVVVCGAVGTAVYEHNARVEAGAELEAQATEVAALRREVSAWESRAKAAEASAADVGDAAKTMKGAEKQPEQAVSAPAQGGTAFDLAATNPEFRALFLAQQRASLRLQYGRLYAKLHLTKEQIAEFEAVQCAQFEAVIDAIAVAHDQGTNSADPALMHATLSEGDWDAKMRHALGDAGVAELREWGDSQIVRIYADNLATQLYFTSAPLNGDQGERLIQLIKANTGAPQDIGMYRAVGSTNWDAVFAQASTVLSADQLTVFRAVIDHQRLLEELSNLTVRLQTGSGMNSR